MCRKPYIASFLLLMACGGGTKAGPPPDVAPRKERTPEQGPTASQAAAKKFGEAVAELDTQKKAGKVDLVALKPLFEAAAKEDKQFAEAHYNLGVIAEAEGKAQDAEKSYRLALAIDSKLGLAATNLAGVLVDQGKVDDALKMLESFVKVDPSQARPRVALAQIYRDKKRYEDALEQCRAALQRDPRNLEAFETMSVTYADMGNPPMSRLVGARGLKVDDKDAIIHYTRGRLVLAENKIPEAVLEFKRALEANPDLRGARIDLAEVALNYRDFGNAKLHYSELLKQTPNDLALLVNLGIANKGLGLTDEAKAAYEKALQLDKQNPAATMNLAILYHRNLNDFAQALKYYQLYEQKPAAEGGPDAATIKAAITELEQTIAALKEAEKFEQMEKERAATQPAQPEQPPPGDGAQQPTPDGQAAPASQPTGAQ
ncbi:MAG: adventurous gliding motility TPR repeat lipoprotein GltE [Deltaproteobacteria bacterium]|nr:adventurous gliding motility TPR repeat lipoprotein GltE [Deltaproteobacteria bacterium]